MTATVKQDGDAMGYANVRIAVNYLQTGTWLDGLDYTLAEDGYSVRIPYAKITARTRCGISWSISQGLSAQMILCMRSGSGVTCALVARSRILK